MVVWRKVNILPLLIVVAKISADSFNSPPAQFNILKDRGFRVYIPAITGISQFKFYANIGQEVTNKSATHIYGLIPKTRDDYFVLEFDNKLPAGSTLYYGTFVIRNRLAYSRDNLKLKIKQSDLLDSYPPLTSGSVCKPSSSVVNGKRAACIGDIIFSDHFIESSINTQNWRVERRIPTSGLFNSYENRPETLFLKSNILYLQPVALQEENDVRGTLDLRDGCTSTEEDGCYYKQQFSFLLPPVKSSMITSKIPFKYGRVEIKAKLPAGEWLFPVIELKPKDRIDGKDPPKIVMVYCLGNDRLTSDAGNEIGSRSLYMGAIMPDDIDLRGGNMRPRFDSNPYNGAFHTYSLEWTSDKLKFFFERETYGEVSIDAPFDKEYVLTLGVAVGGHVDFPDGYKSGVHDKPWINEERNTIKNFFDNRSVWSPTWDGDNSALQIDSVTVTAI